MAKVRLLKVHVERLDVQELIMAAVMGDQERIGRILDAALEFEGVLGGLVERIDGPVFEELAGLIETVILEAIAKGKAEGDGK